MELAYTQHSERARRQNRSSTNVKHLSLAPLTVKLPLSDGDDFVDHQPHYGSTSYLQGKSAPTTPRLLSRSTTPSRSRSHRRVPSAPSGPITKSISSSHLAVATPRRRPHDGWASRDGNDSDWLLRTGALMSFEAREYKGQAWLVSRQSSTSLTGMRDTDDDNADDADGAVDPELARQRDMASRRASRRGSSILADDDDGTPSGSRFPSRFPSRSHSVAENHDSHVGTPLGQEAVAVAGPDFVDLDEKLEELEGDTAHEDEAAVRRLVRRGHSGQGSWISNVIGWSLFSVDEDSDEEDSEDGDGMDTNLDADMTPTGRGGWSARHMEDLSNATLERMPPPPRDEGGWKDAAWLLSVASKVIF